MPEKRSFPLNNPPQEKTDDDGYYHCGYCQWLTKSTGAYRMHISRYHEREVVEEGGRVREGGRFNKASNDRFRLAHGYVKCPWWPDLCATKLNPLMARVCKHMNDCPV